MCTDTNRSDAAPTDTIVDATYDPSTGRVHAPFGADADGVVVAVVEAVATLTDRELVEMPPLFATVDPEALTELVTSSRARSVEVSFSYEGCRVSVSSHGDVVVEPPDRPSS